MRTISVLLSTAHFSLCLYPQFLRLGLEYQLATGWQQVGGFGEPQPQNSHR